MTLAVLWAGTTEAEIEAALKQAVGDHDMATYLRLHRSLLVEVAAEAAGSSV